ncbi:hypothetical protein EVAR_7557_1 [Eumeta japonica]|uniref:Uncharacterized protein n=1 Tax=Eumeta variegata TaxID=151549 RepID=A0A4C1VN79_EUMVA|nr:hypothetical protein EVAR_7557_1 [Eumeta japonica]
MVRTLLRIAKEEDASSAKHRPTDYCGSGTAWHVLNDVIARDFCIETVEEYIQRIARQLYDIAEQSPHEFLRNIAPMYERSPSGRPLPRELNKTPPPKNNPTATKEARLKYRSFDRLKTLSIILPTTPQEIRSSKPLKDSS